MARIEQPSARPRSALVVGALRQYGDSVLATLLSANATWARDSVAAFQGGIGAAWRPHATSAWQFDAALGGAAFAVSDGLRDGNGNLLVRVRRQLSQDVGAYAGGATGHSVRNGDPSHAVVTEAGLTAARGALRVEMGWARTRTEDSLLLAASRIYVRHRTAWLDLDDVLASVSWEHGPLELAVTGRMRRGIRGTDARQSAAFATAAYAVTPRLAVTVGSGRLLADPLRGLPDATVATAAVRVTFADAQLPPVEREADAAVVQQADGGVLIVRVRAPAGAHVEVAGSFSGWEPVPARRVGDLWEAQARVPAGRHRVAYRVDGGPWRAPGNLGRLREFGGEVGLVVVP